MKEVFKNIFMFEVPLYKSALKAINIYVIKNKDRAIVLDTGYNTEESKEVMINNLKELNLEIKDCDLILTHLHADHTGLASFFYENGAKVYMGKVDGELTNGMVNMKYWDLLLSFLPLYGMDKEIGLEDNPGFNYKLDKEINFNILNIGDVIETDDYKFEVVDLIGHTPGHIGLYEKEKGFMFSADTVLDPITPNITFWGYEWENILNTYMNTLRWMKTLNLKTVLPTHRNIITNVNTRIDELIHHHFLRLQEILDSFEVDRDDYTIREISSKISWRIRANSWDDFPKPQKWFACGETMSHMDYLVNFNYVEMRNENGLLKFKKLIDKVVE